MHKRPFWQYGIVATIFVAALAFCLYAQPGTKTSATWFAQYVDVTAFPAIDFENAKNGVVLAFIVAHKSDPCVPGWGGEYTLEQANTQLNLDKRIERAKQGGNNVAVSFGGLENHDLAVTCNDSTKLATAYTSVIERYDIDTIDLDIEASSLQNAPADKRRAVAIAKVISEQKAHGKTIAIWVTLPVTSQGLSEDSLRVVEQLATNTDLAGINGMTMNFGLDEGQTMIDATRSALTTMHHQLSTLYGDRLSTKELWAKIGATPMIGQNDLEGEVFRLDDAKKLHDFAKMHSLGRLSMWSANRDIPCKAVSSFCNGVNEPKGAFARALKD